jgi:precorrin-2 C20-methyltransferase/precorrin-3B C17-methyltransferase
MTSASTGRFWAVGVGPGDPDLLTVKAMRILQQVPVLYHAGPEERAGRAWQIVRGVVRPEQAVRVVRTDAMSALSNGGRAGYRAGVEQIAADCRRGLDVAFVAEGDPTLYSTAAAVWQLLAEVAPEVPIEVVPGVSSISAAAARVRWPLAQRDQALAVVPAGYDRDDLPALLRTFPSVALLKVPQALPDLQRLLAEIGPDYEAVYAENLGTEREWITRDLAAAAGRKEYFALVLVRRVGQAGNLPESPDRLEAYPTSPGRLEACPTKVWVVGLGPGDPRLLTRQALEVLRAAEVVVGYEGYLNLLAPLGLSAERHGSPIGAEAERAAHALELARAGGRVVLVSSGDAGVYGMASLLLETAERLPGVDVEVVPGVTAATAAAALLGAPLGHDFACVSLSDLLTPWEVIERRLEAAGQCDLVLALYNPISRRRTWQLPRAREVLLRHRRPGTPVGLVDRAFRPGTRVTLTTLGDLSPEGVTMETLLIVGSSRTRVINGRLVTPRGYGTQA